ncbi:hypothetical protein RCF98_07160 [Thiothrix lacustris]|uniref:Uncharacterized protein n=1 Tax=Thiothrix lacustris TaxID=525917 RepID=A0ABY9MTX8_9GAMM|nr:hypothetical protein [Thiothrix lacustris]WML92114.1 hypothetical protein RCF98_07160 [Thiothrix lacustris]
MTRTNHRAYGSWIFGVILLGFVFAVFWLAPNALPSFKQQILAFSAALLAGLFGFFLTGDMTLAMSHKESRTSLKAAGGIALFVLVLGWWNSSAAPVIVEQVQQEVSHHDGGQILSTQKQVAYPQREGINIGRDFTISVNDNGRTDVKVDNKIIYQVDTAAIEQL